jgi:hypothetical protein
MRWGAKVTPRRIAAITIGSLALSCGVAQACAISPPSCTSASNGRMSTIYPASTKSENVSLFYEAADFGEKPDTMFLIECKSRKGIKIKLPEDEDGWLPPDDVLDYLVEAATSEKSYTFSQIRAGLRALSQDSRMTTLPDGHCGCELPKMDFIGCADEVP